MKIHGSTIVDITIILAVGLLSITWFRGNFLIGGGDTLFHPDRWQTFARGFYIWDTRSLGNANPRVLAGTIPYYTFLVISEIADLSLIDAEKLWFYLMFISTGLSMYYLTITVIRRRHRHLAGVISALFYMLNPYFAIYMVPRLWMHIIFLPLVLGLYIKGLNEGKSLKYIFLVGVIWALTCTSGYINPKLAILDWIPLFLYFLFYMLVNRKKHVVTQSLCFTGVLLALWGALNAYWILPVGLNLRATIEAPLKIYDTIGTTRLNKYVLDSSSLLEGFRLLGYWAFHSGHKGFPYFYWAPAYGTSIFIAIGFLIPLLTFTSLLHKSRDVHVLFFVLVTIGGLFLMNGAHVPFGWINLFLVTHIPFAIQVFSNPYKIGGAYTALGYAFLLGYVVSVFYSSGSKSKVKESFLIHRVQIFKGIIVGSVIFLVAGLYVFPLWTGDVIYPGNEIIGSNRFSIPSYYYNSSRWLSTQQQDFKIFPLPYSIVGYGAYVWKPTGVNCPDPTASVLHRPVVIGLMTGNIGMSVARFIVGNSTDKVAKILSLMDVKYILFHRDANWKFLEGKVGYVSTTPEHFQSNLNSQEGLFLEKSFGELDFYRNEYWRPKHIYVGG